MTALQLQPIAWVKNTRTEPLDDDWDAIVSEIELADGIAEECLLGLEDFSHVEVIYVFDRVRDDEITWTARHPRGNRSWPRVGIFAQRGKNRPNRLGVSVAPIVSRQGRILTVRGLDAIDGTPVVDLKPVMREFLPRGELRQPAWSTELMRNYYGKPDAAE